MTLGSLIAEPEDGADDRCPYAMARKGERIARWKDELSYLRRNLLPACRDINIRELSRRNIITAVNRNNADGRRGAAAAIWKYAYGFCSWALEQGFIDIHPLANVRRRRRGSRAERLDTKGRALDDREIAAVWAAAGKMDVFGLLVKFCLLCGARRGEAAQLRESYLQSDRIVIPAEITKKGKPHEIPRTALLNQVLEAAQQFRRASSDLVFPSAATGGPVKGFSTMVERIVREAGTARWTMHDTRRTVRTVLGRLGFSNEVGRLCVGQEVAPLDRTYKDSSWDARREAFEKYHAHVAALIGGNVISFEDHAQAAAAG